MWKIGTVCLMGLLSHNVFDARSFSIRKSEVTPSTSTLNLIFYPSFPHSPHSILSLSLLPSINQSIIVFSLSFFLLIRRRDPMEGLEDAWLRPAPLEYDSDAAADEIPADEPVVRNLGQRTCAEIFKNALENRTNSKRALKNHRVQARAPSTQDNQTRWLTTFQAFMKTLEVP